MTPDLIIEAFPYLKSGELKSIKSTFESAIINYSSDILQPNYRSKLSLDLLLYIISSENIQIPSENYVLEALLEIYLINKNCIFL